MIEIMAESSGSVLGLRASGKLTHDDYQRVLIPHLDSLFRQHGKLNLLFLMDEDFAGWELDAAWDDARYGLRHNADFGKLAVVGGPAWVERCIRLAGFLMKGEIRTFSSRQVAQAWDWIRH